MAPFPKADYIEIDDDDEVDDQAGKPTSPPLERLNTLALSFDRFARPARSSFPVRHGKSDEPTETIDLTQDDGQQPLGRLETLLAKAKVGRSPASSGPSKSASLASSPKARPNGDAHRKGPATPASQRRSNFQNTASSPVIVDSDDESPAARAGRDSRSTPTTVSSATRAPKKTQSAAREDASKKRGRESSGPTFADKRQRLDKFSRDSRVGSKDRDIDSGSAHTPRQQPAGQPSARKEPSAKTTSQDRSLPPRTTDLGASGPRPSNISQKSGQSKKHNQNQDARRSSPNAKPADRSLKRQDEATNSDSRATAARNAGKSQVPAVGPSELTDKTTAKTTNAGRASPTSSSSQRQQEGAQKAGLNDASDRVLHKHSKVSRNEDDRSPQSTATVKKKGIREDPDVAFRSQLEPLQARDSSAAAVSADSKAPASGATAVAKRREQEKEPPESGVQLTDRTTKRPPDTSTDQRAESTFHAEAQTGSPVKAPSNSHEDVDGVQMSTEEELAAQFQSEIKESMGKPPLPQPKAKGTPTIDSKMSTPVATDAHKLHATSALPLSKQVERAVGSHLATMRDDIGYYGQMWMKRARRSKKTISSSSAPSNIIDSAIGGEGRSEQRPSVAGAIFAMMAPMQFEAQGTGAGKAGHDDRSFKINLEIAPGTPRATKSSQVFRPSNTENLEDADVPEYAHYVSLDTNMLAPNTMTMSVWPYFGDNEPQGNAFDTSYYVDVTGRPRKLKRLLQAQKAEEYTEMAMKDLDIGWHDVLRVILDPSPDVGTSPDAQKSLANKNSFVREDVPQTSEKWTLLLSNLPVSAQPSLTKAVFLCDSFQRLAGFPIWHVARRSDIIRQQLADQEHRSTDFDHRTCRICLRFNCHQHGELREFDESDSDIGYESDTAVATDLIHPQNVNHRKRVPFISPPDDMSPDANDIDNLEDKRRPGSGYWDEPNYTAPQKRGPFYPCNHPGLSCDDEEANCPCVRDSVPCEKTCACPLSCKHKFRGCSCASTKSKRPGVQVCFYEKGCACYQTGRECDPDVCGSCGVDEVVDPTHRYDDAALSGKCSNAALQRGVPKRTLLGDSGVHGMGLYAGEKMQQDDFLGEYKGEIITSEESERRGTVYDSQGLSYLFALNSKQLIDSAYYGNKIRFINHRSKKESNLYPRTVLVNSVHRIALYSKRPIKAGEELFFDYGQHFPTEKLGGEAKGAKSMPQLSNARQIEGFYSIKEVEDEIGNIRARKAAPDGGARGQASNGPVVGDGYGKAPPKKRGGARPGAGRKKKNPGTEGEKQVASTVDRSAAQDHESDGAMGHSPYREPSNGRFEDYYISNDGPADDGMEDDAIAGGNGSGDEDFNPGDEDEESEESDGEESLNEDDGLSGDAKGKRPAWKGKVRF